MNTGTRRRQLLFSLLAFSSLLASGGVAAPVESIARWSFDREDGQSVTDLVSKQTNRLSGPIEFVPGVKGSAVKLDGFRSHLIQERFPQKDFSHGFTVEAWVAVAMYPWSWAPILDCSENSLHGFFFGVGPDGQLALKLGAGATWHVAESEPVIPLNQWTHVAATFKPGEAVRLYANGKLVKTLEVDGNFVPPKPRRSLSIGRNLHPQIWRERQIATEDAYFHIDGLLDEIDFATGVKSAAAIQAAFTSVGSLPEPALSARDRLPTGPEGDGSFGAFYTRLDYYEEWDAMWRVGEKPDIFVRFDQSPVQMVFWRGASFVPCWVTENDTWYTNEWLETWGADVFSCAEPIMDRHCRFSHVRLIENTPARVVIHWRYALNDTFYNFAAVSDDGRGEWADEYHIIYPDQVGVRKIDLHYSTPERKHDWVEQIVVLPPGKYPDDVIERDAISLLNMQGEVEVYTWSETLAKEMPRPKGANISHVNLKSTYQPFIVVPPDPVDTVEGKWDSPFFRSFAAGQTMPGFRPDPVPTVFGWWDHWPVAQIPGDGRWVTTPDRPSHFNLTTFVQWKDHNKTERTRTRIMLQGMVDAAPEQLVPLAKSWLQAPAIRTNAAFQSQGYDSAERAYILERRGKPDAPCSIHLAATGERPLHNPALILRNWGKQTAKLSIDGVPVASGPKFRQGLVQSVEGHDLIVWLELEATEPVQLKLMPDD